MNSFQSLRVAHEFTQTNAAPPSEVFPLLCPVREAEWLPGWRYRLVHSDSGVAELGCVFTTPNPEGSGNAEKTWIVTDYDRANFRIAFVWIDPGRIITEIGIHLAPAEPGVTHTNIRYRYTGLSEDGNCELRTYERNWFEAKMKDWETVINHFLQTGTKMSV
jgi:hypothetical protein